jgi:hypothetical protein
MAAVPGTVVLTIRLDDDAYQEATDKLRTLAALAKQAHPVSRTRQLFWDCFDILLIFLAGALSARYLLPA